MSLARSIILIRELLSRDPNIVPEASPITILDSKSDVCMANDVKDKNLLGTFLED